MTNKWPDFFFFPLNLIMSISWKIFQVLSLKAIGWHSVVKYFLSGSQEWINELTHTCLGIPPSTPIEKLYPEEASKARGSTVTKGDLGMLHRYGHWCPEAVGWVQGHPAGWQQAPKSPNHPLPPKTPLLLRIRLESFGNPNNHRKWKTDWHMSNDYKYV